MRTTFVLAVTFSLALTQGAFANPGFGSVAANDVLTGVNGNVVLGEYSEHQITPALVAFQPGHYFLDVVGTDVAPIYGFAVSTTPGAIALTDRPGWSAQTLTPQSWNAGVPVGDGDFTTSQLGSFADFFGTAPAVNLYFNNGANAGVDITEATDQDQTSPGIWDSALYSDPNNRFYWVPGTVTSDFVAFNGNGGVVDKSLRAPDGGSTIALLGLAFAGLAALRNRSR